MEMNHLHWRRALRYGALLLLLLIIVQWTVAVDMVTIWWRSATFNHCFLIPLLSAYLIREKRMEWCAFIPVFSQRALLIFVPVVVLTVVADWMQLAAAQHFMLIASLVTVVWYVVGDQLFHAWLFPLLFLFFAVPFGEFLIPVLQDITAAMAVFLLKLGQMPVFVEDRHIAIPGGDFVVAEACSGVNYLIASLALGSIFSYWQFRSMRARLFFMVLALLVPLLANGLRVYGIIMIAYWSDMKYAVGVDHIIYGGIFFGVVLVLLYFCSRWIPDSTPTERHSSRMANQPISPMSGYPLALLLILPWLVKQMPEPVAVVSWAALSSFEQVSRHDVLEWPAKIVHPSSLWQKSDKDVIQVVGIFDGQIAGQELVNSLHHIYEPEQYRRLQASSIAQEDYAFNTQLVRDRHGREWLVWQSYVLPSAVLASAIKTKLLQLPPRLLWQAMAGAYLILATPQDDNAIMRLQQQAQESIPVIQTALQQTASEHQQ